jgi:hypothetical protein
MPVTWWYTPTYSTSALSTSAERKRAAYLLLHISDGLLDQVDEVGRAELAEGVERLGAGLDCGMQLLLEDPTMASVSIWQHGERSQLQQLSDVGGEEGRCGYDWRNVVRHRKLASRILRNSWSRHHGSDVLAGHETGSDSDAMRGSSSMRPRYEVGRAGLGGRGGGVGGRGSGSGLCRSFPTGQDAAARR